MKNVLFYKLLKRLLIQSFSVVVILYAVQVFVEYLDVENNYKVMALSFGERFVSRFDSLDQIRDDALQEYAEILFSVPNIRYVGVMRGDVVHVEKGEADSLKSVRFENFLYGDNRDKPSGLQALRVVFEVEKSTFVNQVLRKSVHDLAVLMSFVVFVTVVTSYQFWVLIWKHVESLSEVLRIPNIAFSDSAIVLNKKKNGDELDVIVEAINNIVENLRLMHNKLLASRDKLRKSERRYRTLFTANNSVKWIISAANASVVDVNPAGIDFYGYERRTFLSMKVTDINMLDPRQVVEKMSCIPVGVGKQFFFKHKLASGDIRDVEVHSAAFYENGEKLIFSIIHDITARLQAERHLQEVNTSLEKSVEAANALAMEAKCASQTKSEFLANMSHEIRTPLSGVLGMLDLLQGTDLSSEQSDYVALATVSLKRLTRLLTDIIDVSRIGSGSMSLRSEPFALHKTIKQSCDTFAASAAQKGIALHLRVSDNVPRYVVGDSFRLQQVLTNIVGNALKFTRAGSIDVEVYRLPSVNGSTYRIFFAVADTGCGIPDESLAALFKPFSQVSKGYARRYQGAGLGLAICKELVTLMRGNIAIESEVNVGTTLYFCSTFEKSYRAAEISPRTVESDAPVRTIRVLLVEDDFVNLITARKMLEKIGHSVTSAKNGKEGLDLYGEHEFDLIMTDIQMPVMDGISMVKAIRSEEALHRRRRIPIIAVTAYAASEDRKRILASGVDCYLSKPLASNDLSRVVDAALGGATLMLDRQQQEQDWE